MTFETILYEVSEGIATITINRPEVLNALNMQVLRDLLAATELVRKDPQSKVAILTGAGRSFVAGADISQMRGFTVTQGLEFGDLGHAVLRAFETLDKPVLAAVNGFALGGGTEISMGCDFIYASTKAKFGQPEVSLGIIPGFGGTQRLARIVGMNKARELIYTGDVISAEEAKRIGLVSELYEPEELLSKVRERARLLMSKGPLAISAAKRCMNKGVDISLDAALELEKQAFAALFGTEDQKEGMGAFVEKRLPSFLGR
ncbi:MAG: enoyl-CoA hydratase-related protein [Myxococcota bacterium]|jgi:enoyl-CoA hydratase|nr:enoyl-CoA hydratase-related protein [Myxococcota bacterium]